MTEKLVKVFVGNIDYQSTDNDLRAVLKDVDGYVSSGVVKRPNTSVSKGYGYMLFKTQEQADAFLSSDQETVLNSRDLRFTMFSESGSMTSNCKLFIEELPLGTTKNDIQECFKEYVDMTSCYINDSRRDVLTSVLVFATKQSCDDILEKQFKINGKVLKIKPYKPFTQTYTQDSRKCYNNGYKSGYTVGFQEGFQKGLASAMDWAKN